MPRVVTSPSASGRSHRGTPSSDEKHADDGDLHRSAEHSIRYLPTRGGRGNRNAVDRHGKAHDLLLEVDWKTAKLTNVVKGALQQHNANASRIEVSGPQIEIASAAMLPLRSVMNELCTKATKYGALSDDKGLSLLIGPRLIGKVDFIAMD